MSRLVDLDNRPVEAPPGAMVMSRDLADKLNVEAGDRIEVEVTVIGVAKVSSLDQEELVRNQVTLPSPALGSSLDLYKKPSGDMQHSRVVASVRCGGKGPAARGRGHSGLGMLHCHGTGLRGFVV